MVGLGAGVQGRGTHSTYASFVRVAWAAVIGRGVRLVRRAACMHKCTVSPQLHRYYTSAPANSPDVQAGSSGDVIRRGYSCDAARSSLAPPHLGRCLAQQMAHLAARHAAHRTQVGRGVGAVAAALVPVGAEPSAHGELDAELRYRHALNPGCTFPVYGLLHSHLIRDVPAGLDRELPEASSPGPRPGRT